MFALRNRTAVPVHEKRMVRANGVDIRAQAMGDPADPCVLMVQGANAPMIRWEDEFCLRVASAGRYVIRYDNRDTGHSTTFPAGSPGYDVSDLAKDAVGVLDAYGIEEAHVIGFSMGGMICQHLAFDHAGRVLSAVVGGSTYDPSALTALAVGEGMDTGRLPGPPQKTIDMLGFLSTVDWTDERQALEGWIREDIDLLGSGDVPNLEGTRALLTQVVREARDIVSHRTNHPIAVNNTPSWGDRLKDVRVPTLVIHGTDDGCLPLPHGRAVAGAIPGAKLMVVEGMGHILAVRSPYFDVFADAVIEHTGG
jgi:pimeloyl-ACP methyl ester carboxylesterase